jgi:tetratricopeptide (TPR) repeat protein
VPSSTLIALLFINPQPAADACAGAPDRNHCYVEAWASLVRQHWPGEADAPVILLADWEAAELERVLFHLPRYARSKPLDQEAMNEMLRRGALMHTDLAILLPERAEAFTGLRNWAPLSKVQVRDGQPLRKSAISGQWRFARQLLGLVRPAPAEDDTVVAWYRTVAAYLHSARENGANTAHLTDARRQFPLDPAVWFFSAVFHESLASATIQEGATEFDRSQPVSRSRRERAVGSRRTELETAGRYLRKALDLSPAYAEARLRRGRVLQLLGRPEEAARELRAALGDIEEPLLRYYGELFLGAAEEMRGRRTEARGCYERAAALQPRAQSPLLALSHLARASGDRNAAQRYLERLTALPPDPDERDEPLWDYDIAPGRHAAERLASLRARFTSEPEP